MDGKRPWETLRRATVVARPFAGDPAVRAGPMCGWMSPIGMARFAKEFPAIDRRCDELGSCRDETSVPLAPAITTSAERATDDGPPAPGLLP